MKKHILKVWLLMVMSLMAGGVWGQAPTVVTLSPEDNSPAVDVNTSSFVITFSEEIKFSAGGGNAILYDGVNYVTSQYLISGNNNTVIDNTSNTLSITFGITLDYEKEYNIVIPSGAIESYVTGVPFTGLSSGQWSFTTEAESLQLTWVTLSPEDNSPAVDVNTSSFVITFSEEIKFSAGGGNAILYDGVNYVTSQYLISGNNNTVIDNTSNTLSITFGVTLDYEKEYNIVIPSGAIESNNTGVPFAGLSSGQWSFTTEAESLPLTWVTLSPEDNSPAVDKNTSSFVITFSEEIKFSTGGGNAILYDGVNYVTSQYLISGNNNTVIDNTSNTLSITFGITLDYEKEYNIVIPSGAIESNNTGVPFAGLSSGQWSFTTEAQPLELTLTSPEDGDSNVLLTESLVATFNQNIQFATDAEVYVFTYDGDGLFETLTDGAGLSITGMDLTINPTTDFAEGTRYYVIIPAVAIETTTGTPFSGVILKDDWDFTTVSLPLNPPTLSPIDGAPVAPGAPGVPRNSILEVTFDMDIELSGAGSIGIWANGSREKLLDGISSNVSIFNNNTLRIDLSADPLADYATLYDVRISSDFIKRIGSEVYFAGFTAGEWSFTTEAEPFELITKSPVEGALDVPLAQSLVATFNQNIQLAAEASISVYAYNGDVLFETLTAGAGLSVLGMELTINPTVDFAEGTRYYVVIPAGAIETTSAPVASFSGVTLKDDWDFTTTNLPPSVVSYDPDGLSAVAIDKVLNLTFDRPVKLSENTLQTIRIARNSDASTFYTYYINGVDTDVLLSVSGNVLTIIPPVNYESNTDYYVEISDGAILSLDDKSFPGISGTTTWTFTSVVAAAPPVVDTGGYSPVTGSIEISRNPVLELTFNENIVKGSFGYLRIFTSEDDEEIFLIPRSQVSVVDNKLTVSLSYISLLYGTQYYVTIDPGFVKSSTTGVDFGGISSSSEWFFTTETAPPFWADGYPLIRNQNANTFDLVGQVDQAGTFYYVVADENNQLDHSTIYTAATSGGNGGFLLAGNGATTVNAEFLTGPLSTLSLEYGQNYYLFVYTASGNKNSEIIRLDIDRVLPRLRVQDTYPSAGYSVMPVNDAIVLNFSEKLYVVGNDILVEITEANAGNYIQLFKDGGIDPIAVTYTISTDGKVHTLSPSAVLDENASYKVVIGTVSDEFGNLSSIPDHTFSTDKEQVWLGVSNSWADNSNWTGGFVSGKSVIIPADALVFPEISLPADIVNVHNLTIAPGAVLSHSGGTLNVNGLFHLQSSSDVNASYINTGGVLNALADSIRVDQVISNIDLTYIISSPTNSSTAANFGSYYPLYRYDNSKDSWEAIPSAMTPGVGYRMWTDDTMVSFTGSFNTGNIEVSLLRTDGKGYGWNFVGNPYPASIDWTELGITEASSVENAFWMWLPGSRAYGSFSAATNIPINILSSKIPSNHGFLVKVKKELGSGSITFLPEAQVGNSTSYLKSASAREVAPHFKLAGVSSSFRDELAIAFVDEATLGLDKFDMEKKFAERKNIFELYSISGEAMSVINALPSADKIEIPLGYNALQKGDYSIEMLSNSEGNASIVLVDKILGVETSMVVGSKYDFTINEIGKSISRFTLKIEKVLTSNQEIKNADNSKAVTVFANDGEIFVNQISAGVFNRYSIVDVQGRLVKEGVLSSAIGSKALGAFDKGLYIVSFSNGKDKNVMNSKVVVY